MCGIVGIASNQDKINPALLECMCQSLEHRGPDDHGAYYDTNQNFAVALGSHRLSILDLSPAGHMPMSTPDESIWITYNGELYNHAALRKDLERAGYKYRSRTDTETILYAYQEYGLDCLAKFDGIFAFCLYDRVRRRLVLARDRLGIKPLYYSWDGQQLYFASELKVLLEVPQLSPSLNPQALDIYLALGYVPSPYSLVEGVQKLKPGHYLVFDGAKTEVAPYYQYQLSPTVPNITEAELIAQTRQTVEAAVRSQLMSDVPLGVLLSGGLDSTIVAALVQKYHSGPVDTFSVGFRTARSALEPLYNYDIESAAQVAARLGTRHHEIILDDSETLVSQLQHLVKALDEPAWEPSFLSIFALCQLAREHGVKVVLTGDGSDELFGGYPWYIGAQRLALYEQLPFLNLGLPVLAKAFSGQTLGIKARDLQQKYRQSAVTKYIVNYAHLDQAQRVSLLGADKVKPGRLESYLAPLLSSRPAGYSVADQFAFTDLYLWVAEHFNQRLDRMSMLASVEARVPFQANAVVNHALGIPMKYKIRNGQQKYLLRQAFRDIIPPEVLQRPKRPFAAPAKAWLQGVLNSNISNFRDWAAVNQGILDARGVARLFEQGAASQFANPTPFWILLNLEFWLQSYPKLKLSQAQELVSLG